MKTFIQITFLLGFAPLAFAGSKLASDLPPGTSNTPVDVIIQFKAPPSKDELKLLGPYGQAKKTYNSINAIFVTISPNTFAALAADPNVRYISPNRAQKGFLDVTTASVGASFAWQSGFDGSGVGVAVIDSGIALRHDLTGPDGVTSRVIYSESFVTGADASDAYGHGTHVAGIVGSAGRDSSGIGFTRTFKGVAPNVNLINLRVLDQNGGGLESGSWQPSAGDRPEEHLQHPRDQSVTRTQCIRELHTRSALPGGGSGLESGHRGSNRGRQLWA
jgi:Subtilisin-like serine proteases